MTRLFSVRIYKDSQPLASFLPIPDLTKGSCQQNIRRLTYHPIQHNTIPLTSQLPQPPAFRPLQTRLAIAGLAPLPPLHLHDLLQLSTLARPKDIRPHWLWPPPQEKTKTICLIFQPLIIPSFSVFA